MADLRCKTPELARKEIWTHVLAYNLIRTVMAQAAATHGLEPRSISFKGAMQTLEAFQPAMELVAATDREQLLRMYQQLLRAIATHLVADRPDRFEPRAKKRRRDHFAWLTKPWKEIKRKMAKGFTKILSAIRFIDRRGITSVRKCVRSDQAAFAGLLLGRDTGMCGRPMTKTFSCTIPVRPGP